MSPETVKPSPLREACVQEALAIIDTRGLEALSLREVARRLGVSHQAPYKHFASRDKLLAEVITRAFESFIAHLRTKRSGPEIDDVHAVGDLYLGYAHSHPLQYRLMFSTPLPDPKDNPEMMARAQMAFGMLRGLMSQHPDLLQAAPEDRDPDADAMFVWAAMHGLASIRESDAVRTLGYPPERVEEMMTRAMKRVRGALARDV